MFILPVTAHPFVDNAVVRGGLLPLPAFPGAAVTAEGQQMWQWQQTLHWLLAPLRLPLTLALTLVVFLLVRALLTSSSPFRLRKGDKVAVPVAASSEKAEKPASVPSSTATSSRSWLAVIGLTWETLPVPSMDSIAHTLPISLNAPPAPAMRGRHVYRGGRGVGFNTGVRRPEVALASKPRVEAPLPAIYESQTPVSMAKMIMSRHTYRRPSLPPSPRRSPSAGSYTRRPPSPEYETFQHTRSASV